MNDPTSEAVRHRLDLVLRQWRNWQLDQALQAAPELERQMDAGVSNHSFLVGSAQRRFVVRIDGIQTSRHGLNRAAEWKILCSAHSAGIAPAPCYYNPELGALVTGYLVPDATQSLSPAQLGALLRTIHTLPARRYRLDIAERIARYEGQLQRDDRYTLPAEYHRPLQACMDAAPATPPVLCHNDLIATNLLRSAGRWHALDWEYSAMGNHLFDLAGAALGQQLAPGEDRELFGHYLGTAPSAQQRVALQQQRVLCRYIEMLWYLLEASAGSANSIGARHLPLLEAELAALA